MSKKKGLSFDEKKQKMLDLFYEKKEFFQLKELEKLGPKEKGVISQSVKEAVTALVDDGLVESEKIGTFVCYWAFPSKALNTKTRRVEDLKRQETELDEAIGAAQLELDGAAVGKQPSEDRSKLEGEAAALEAEKGQLEKEVGAFADCDPHALALRRRQARTVQANANICTENVFALKQWCKAKFNMEEDALNKQFDIPADLDYVQFD